MDAEFGIKFEVTIDLNNLKDKVKTMYEAVQNSVEKVAAGLQVDVSQKTSNQIVIIIMIILFMALMVVSAA